MSIKNFNLSDPIMKAFHKRGYFMSSPNQQKAILPIIYQNELIGSAQMHIFSIRCSREKVFEKYYRLSECYLETIEHPLT